MIHIKTQIEGMKNMYLLLIFCLYLLANPILGFAQDDRFQEITISILKQQLRNAHLGTSASLMEKIARETNLSQNELYSKLLAQIDRLDNQRQQKTEIWYEIISARKEQVPTKKAEKFMQLLLEDVRKKIKKKGNYSLKSTIERAARKAKLDISGKEYLADLLIYLSRDTTSILAEKLDLSNKIGVKIKIEINRNPEAFKRKLENSPRNLHFQFFKTRNPDIILSKITDATNSLLSEIIREFPNSPQIKWAVERATPKLQPNYLLLLKTHSINIGVDFSTKQLVPCFGGTMELQRFGSKSSIFYHQFPPICGPASNSGYEQVLEEFYVKCAQELRIHYENLTTQ